MTAIYEQPAAAASRAIAASPATPVERAAALVARASTAARPRARYIVGRDAHLTLWVLRRLPERVRGRVTLRALGIA